MGKFSLIYNPWVIFTPLPSWSFFYTVTPWKKKTLCALPLDNFTRANFFFTLALLVLLVTNIMSVWRLKRITAAGAHEIFRFYNCKPQSMQSEPFTVLHGSAHFFSTFNILCQNFRIKWLELLLAPLYTFTTQFPEKEFHSRA